MQGSMPRSVGMQILMLALQENDLDIFVRDVLRHDDQAPMSLRLPLPDPTYPTCRGSHPSHPKP
eukprot:362632-Chlamydomonas_euryale.AAC.5